MSPWCRQSFVVSRDQMESLRKTEEEGDPRTFRTTTRRIYDRLAITYECHLNAVEDRPLAAADRTRTEDIQTILCESPCLIKTDNVQFTTHIHSVDKAISNDATRLVGIYTLLWTDAENALFLETRQCKIGANGESCWQSRWDNYRDQIKCANDNEMPCKLKMISSPYWLSFFGFWGRIAGLTPSRTKLMNEAIKPRSAITPITAMYRKESR